MYLLKSSIIDFLLYDALYSLLISFSLEYLWKGLRNSMQRSESWLDEMDECDTECFFQAQPWLNKIAYP